MAWPLCHLGKTLRFIMEGYFYPDETRSGTWAHNDDAYAAEAFNAALKDTVKRIITDDVCRGPEQSVVSQELKARWDAMNQEQKRKAMLWI